MKTVPETEVQSLKNKGLTDEKIIQDLIEFKENNPKLLKKTMPCEMYDKVNLMCRKYMDRMARFEVDYDFRVDETAFKNVAEEFTAFLVILNPLKAFCRHCVDYFVNFIFRKQTSRVRGKFFAVGGYVNSGTRVINRLEDIILVLACTAVAHTNVVHATNTACSIYKNISDAKQQNNFLS